MNCYITLVVTSCVVLFCFVGEIEQRSLVAEEDEPVTKLDREISELLHKHLEKGKLSKDIRNHIQRGHKDLLQIQQQASSTEVTSSKKRGWWNSAHCAYCDYSTKLVKSKFQRTKSG